MPKNSTTKTFAAQVKCLWHCWHNLSACQKWGRGMVVALVLLATIALFVVYGYREEIAMAVGYRAAMNEMTPGAQFFRDFIALCFVAMIIAPIFFAWGYYSHAKKSRKAKQDNAIGDYGIGDTYNLYCGGDPVGTIKATGDGGWRLHGLPNKKGIKFENGALGERHPRFNSVRDAQEAFILSMEVLRRFIEGGDNND